MKIQLIGVSKRGKERIKQNSDDGTFNLLRVGKFKGNSAVLVESIINNWMGWFNPGEVKLSSNENITVLE